MPPPVVSLSPLSVLLFSTVDHGEGVLRCTHQPSLADVVRRASPCGMMRVSRDGHYRMDRRRISSSFQDILAAKRGLVEPADIELVLS
ncbi:hypothetical protein BC835DRAFT_979303 [Cytidiella melzeri]|nr:hypothetical protein BC835DRAFT_979303 [Cytidiella melzeri]